MRTSTSRTLERKGLPVRSPEDRKGEGQDEVTQSPGFPLLSSGSADCILDMMREPRITGNTDNKIDRRKQL